MTAFQDRGVDETVSDAELIALFCRALDEVEVLGELDELTYCCVISRGSYQNTGIQSRSFRAPIEITKRFLVGLGIPEANLSTKAYGEEFASSRSMLKMP